MSVNLLKNLGLVFLISLSLSCSSDQLTTPDPSASPTPTPAPSPSPSPDMTCAPDRAEITAYLDEDGERNTPIFAWGLGQIALVAARIYNVHGENLFLKPQCEISSFTVWEIFGVASCFPQGNIHSPEMRLRCTSGGDIRIDAHVGGEDATAVFRVIGGEIPLN